MFSHHHLLLGNARGVGHSWNKCPRPSWSSWVIIFENALLWGCPTLRYHAGISKNGMPSLLCISFSKMPCEFLCSVMWPAIH
jgi:hypothetical protein